MPATRRSDEESDAAVRARGAGRPLDEAVDRAILDAGWRLLLQEGYARLSIAGVAQAAKVGRPAIYRRYKDKSDLVAAVIADKAANVAPIDSGNTYDDLVTHLELTRKRFTVTLAGTMIVEERNHPELLEQFRTGMVVPRRDSIAESLDRGKERGEIRADLDSQIASHALMGSFIFSYLAGGRPPKGWSERVVDTLWPAFAA
jgi:AcrR family transcriptional regulator